MSTKDKFAQGIPAKPASWTSNFRVRPMPRLRESVSGNQLLDGFAMHDTANELWRQDLEKSINERITTAQTTSPAAATPAAATAEAVASAASPAGVSSVNGKTGAVSLTSDDIAQGATNAYMTSSGWQGMYDAFGYGRNRIAYFENIVIPAERNAVIAGALSVDGKLTVNGILMALPL